MALPRFPAWLSSAAAGDVLTAGGLSAFCAFNNDSGADGNKAFCRFAAGRAIGMGFVCYGLESFKTVIA